MLVAWENIEFERVTTFALLSCGAFNWYVEGGLSCPTLLPTKGKIYFTMQFKCGLA